MGHPFKLRIEDDEGKVSVVPLELGEASIGRFDGNTIRLNERNISRNHARIRLADDGVVVEDLDSYNGVFVSGQRISGSTTIHSGDVLRIGDFQMELSGDALTDRGAADIDSTDVNDLESTQPEIKMPASRPTAELDDTPDQAAEPTAIIRLDHLQALENARDASDLLQGPRPKLVCISPAFAGQEFELSKADSVIGRTEENDVQIDHRSVSRSHARIVLEGGTFKIVDLGSANGTLVNGEQYARLSLQSGDVIELGHVKFRFVMPGEPYQFQVDETTAVDSGQANTMANEVTRRMPAYSPAHPAAPIERTNKVLIAAVAGLVLVLAVLITWIASSGSNQAAPAASAQAVAQPAAPQGVAALLVQAKTYISQRQWERAKLLLDRVLDRDPTNEEVLDLMRTVARETTAKQAFDTANGAIGAQDWDVANSAIAQISPDSAYYNEANLLLGQVRTALIGEKVTLVEAALGAKDRERVERLIGEIAIMEPEHPRLPELRSAMQTAFAPRPVTAARTPRPRTHTAKPTAPARPTPPAAAAPPPAKPAAERLDPATLYRQGIKALKANKTVEAIKVLEKCAQVDRTYCRAYRALGIAHARQNNANASTRYYGLYLKCDPNAKDAAQVRKLLETYESR